MNFPPFYIIYSNILASTAVFKKKRTYTKFRNLL